MLDVVGCGWHLVHSLLVSFLTLTCSSLTKVPSYVQALYDLFIPLILKIIQIYIAFL